jgi:tripartite-type tricarboxylate transporter receptor subunit TctC
MPIAIGRRTAIAGGLAAGALAAPCLARNGQAQNLRPGDRSARIVVPFAAGGTTDLVARVVAGILSESTGWTFAIENKTGGEDPAAGSCRHRRHEPVSVQVPSL